jgi:hypothetical protein
MVERSIDFEKVEGKGIMRMGLKGSTTPKLIVMLTLFVVFIAKRQSFILDSFIK